VDAAASVPGPCREDAAAPRHARDRPVRPDKQVPEADEGYTRFLRDGILVSVDHVNFSTDDLLGDIVDRIWG
jgi:hypothetical protein